MKTTIEEQIEEVFNDLRPYLNAEGGNIELIKYENGTVFVRMSGACTYCMFQDDTINDSILKSLQDKIPEIKEVINVQI